LQFEGFDHIDMRVPSLAKAQRFYDKLMPALGLSVQRFAHVDAAGDWKDVGETTPCNVLEYYSAPAAGAASFFLGVIEDAGMQPTSTRIAFRLSSLSRLEEMGASLPGMGALSVERSADWETYPAVFFEDPCGTKLELCCRKPAR